MLSTQGVNLSWMNGTITKRPTMPKMMLGMAASISMPVPTTRATAGCTSSTRSSAMTSASGTAMTMAISVLRAVPASAARAPYSPVLGDQATWVSMLKPSSRMAGSESHTRTPASPNMVTATVMPDAVASTRKIGSPRRSRRPPGAAFAAPGGSAPAGSLASTVLTVPASRESVQRIDDVLITATPASRRR